MRVIFAFPSLPNGSYEHRQERCPSVFRRLITSAKIPNMANMEDCRKPLVDLEHGNLPDLVAGIPRFVLRERNKPEKRLTALERISGTASTTDKSMEKIVTEATFSQGGPI